MAKDPAFLFYTSDFLTGVISMSMKERGQYITLLCLQHQRGHLTLEDMRKVAGTLSEEVLSKFIKDDDGKYYNERTDIEIQKRTVHSQKQRDNINKRWNNNGIQDGNTMVLPLENENEIDNKNITLDDSNVLSLEDTGVAREEEKDIFLDRSFSPELQIEIKNWLRYKSERRESYKSTGLKKFLTQIENKLKEVSEAQIINAMSESMACNYQGFMWKFEEQKTVSAAPKREKTFSEIIAERTGRAGST